MDVPAAGPVSARLLAQEAAGLQAGVEGVGQARPELPAHRAVHAEVDGAVDERHDVDEVAERHVDLAEEAAHHHAEDDQHALRDLGHDVHDDDGQQHHGGAAVLLVAGRVLAPLQPPPTLVRLPQGAQQQPAEDGDEDDGDDLAGDGVDEEGEERHGVRLVLPDGGGEDPELGGVGRVGVGPQVRDQVVGDHQEGRAAEGADDQEDGRADRHRLGPASLHTRPGFRGSHLHCPNMQFDNSGNLFSLNSFRASMQIKTIIFYSKTEN